MMLMMTRLLLYRIIIVVVLNFLIYDQVFLIYVSSVLLDPIGDAEDA